MDDAENKVWMQERVNEQMGEETNIQKDNEWKKTTTKWISWIIIINLELWHNIHDFVTSQPAVYNFCCLPCQVESPLGSGHLDQIINVSIACNLQTTLFATGKRERKS